MKLLLVHACESCTFSFFCVGIQLTKHKEAGGDDVKFLGDQLVLSNGLSLRLSVFIFRMCLFPYSLLIIARDIWGAVSSSPPEGALSRAEWSQISSFQSLFFLVATASLCFATFAAMTRNSLSFFCLLRAASLEIRFHREYVRCLFA